MAEIHLFWPCAKAAILGPKWSKCDLFWPFLGKNRDLGALIKFSWFWSKRDHDIWWDFHDFGPVTFPTFFDPKDIILNLTQNGRNVTFFDLFWAKIWSACQGRDFSSGHISAILGPKRPKCDLFWAKIATLARWSDFHDFGTKETMTCDEIFMILVQSHFRHFLVQKISFWHKMVETWPFLTFFEQESDQRVMLGI